MGIGLGSSQDTSGPVTGYDASAPTIERRDRVFCILQGAAPRGELWVFRSDLFVRNVVARQGAPVTSTTVTPTLSADQRDD